MTKIQGKNGTVTFKSGEVEMELPVSIIKDDYKCPYETPIMSWKPPTSGEVLVYKYEPDPLAKHDKPYESWKAPLKEPMSDSEWIDKNQIQGIDLELYYQDNKFWEAMDKINWEELHIGKFEFSHKYYHLPEIAESEKAEQPIVINSSTKQSKFEYRRDGD